MNATAPPPKPAVILAAPIHNVEESRAQRLQRQQARFRDRGGIFVPTNRNTLLDILLGKASPLKKPRRSASASPSRAKSTDYEVSKPALRRSPRKQSQKTVDVVTEEQPPAIMTDGPESEVGKPIKKATSSKSSKSRPQETKAPPKRTKKPRGTSVVDESVVDTPTEKTSKRTVDASEKRTLNVSTKKTIPNADDDIEDDVPVVKSKAKGKAVNKMNSKAEVDGEKGASKTRGRKPASATTSTAVTSSTRLKRTRKVEPIYSELSEDDAACSMPTKKVATTKVKKSALPPDVAEDKVKGLPSSQGVKVSSLKDMLGVARPTKSLNASDDDGDDDFKSKSKSKVANSQGKPQEDDSAYKPTKKSSTKKMLEDDVACKPAKKSTKESAPPVEMGNFKSLKEHTSAKEDAPSSESTSKTVVASSKGKKRTSASIAEDSDSQLRRKLIKSGTTDIDPSLHKNSNLSGEAPLVTSKKRRRNPKDAESEVEGTDKGTKRKKHSSPSESRQSPEINVEEDSVKPVAKRSRKVAKSTRKGKKQSSDKSTTTSKRKENAMSKPSKKVASNSGPPKSVLQRIKNSLGAQVIDNEPDPIDFLS